MNDQPSQVTIVTGGARGIGAAIARRAAAGGAPVAVADLDLAAAEALAAELTETGARAIGVQVDVADEQSVQAAVDTVADRLGPIGVLVNNAGVTRDNLLFKMTLEDWDTVMGVHLRGSFLMARACQAHMTAQKWGRIVNLSSIAALGNRGQSNYSAAKAGLQGLTKTLAIELGRFGITTNAVAPGFVETEMTRATAERIGVSFEEFKTSIAGQTPVGRVGVPADIANAVAFFTGPEASYVNGQILYVSGGPED